MTPMATPLITLTTDFGTRDAYVGAMKGVIAGIAPKAVIIDISHEVPPHDVQHAAFVMYAVWPYYPTETIHVAVVDPGVGSDRAVILARYAGRYLLAPDNGLVTMVHRHFPIESATLIENRSYFLAGLSATFHGRDVFAPVAAHLACGVKPSRLGRPTDRLEMLPLSLHGEIRGDGVAGRVIYVDRFGSLITNIRRQDLGVLLRSPRDLRVYVQGADVGPIRGAYGDVAAGEPAALISSSGFLEISVNQGRAADRLGAGVNGTVDVKILRDLRPLEKTTETPRHKED